MSDRKTSAALYNLVFRAAAEMGMLPTNGSNPVRGEAQVPHDRKGLLLHSIFQYGGANAVLSLGYKMLSYQSNLTIAVMNRPAEPVEIIRRWQRLERIYHTHHRTQLVETTDGLLLKHTATKGPPPEQLSDLLIAGIMLALFRIQGCRSLCGRFADGTVFVRNDEVCLGTLAQSLECSQWHFTWQRRSGQPELRSVSSADHNSLIETVQALFLSDPAQVWHAAQVGERCGMSVRTLQRRLAAEGTTFRVLLRDCRANAAAALLRENCDNLTEIAFATGYADQPHFTREFKRCIGMSPGDYQALTRRAIEP